MQVFQTVMFYSNKCHSCRKRNRTYLKIKAIFIVFGDQPDKTKINGLVAGFVCKLQEASGSFKLCLGFT